MTKKKLARSRWADDVAVIGGWLDLKQVATGGR